MDTPLSHTDDQATQEVANKLIEMLKAGKANDAIKTLYADNARHIEAAAMPGSPRITEGKATILARSEHFHKANTIHSQTFGTPLVNGDQFTCEMGMDCTSNEGPMAGHRMKMSETCLYTVRGGKIIEAKFFYSMGGK